MKEKLFSASGLKDNLETEYLDYPALCRWLKIGYGTARNWKYSGRLTYCKIGAKVLFPRRDIERLLHRNTVKATVVAFEEFKNKQGER